MAVHTAVLLGLPAPEVEPAGRSGPERHITVLGIVQLASSPETAPVAPAEVAPAPPAQPAARPSVTEPKPTATTRSEPLAEPPEAHSPPAGVLAVELAPRGAALPPGSETPEERAPEPEPERPEGPTERDGAEPEEPVREAPKAEVQERRGREDSSKPPAPGEHRSGPQRAPVWARQASPGLRGVPGSRRATRGALQSVRARYLAHVLRRIQMVKFYPAEARRGRRQGTVKVRFTVLRDGSVTGLSVTHSSGHAVLDGAALATVKRAAPFGAIPAELGVGRLDIVVPIVYRLR